MKRIPIVLILLLTMPALSGLSEDNGQENPQWFRELNFEAPMKSNVVDQYFYITDNLLAPAYKAQGNERELLFKKSIIAYAGLIEQFTDRRDANLSCMSQYQVAGSYRQLGDASMAKRAYEKCLAYRKYVKEPPKDAADTEIMAIMDAARQKLGELR